MPDPKPSISYISVTVLNTLIKHKLEEEDDLRGLAVKGEISNWKRYRSGVFFDLKDEKGSVISCILWSDNYLYLPFEPKDGDEVIAYGNVTVYVPRGRYSLQVAMIYPFGQGAALLALEALKKKLAAEGLFDESRKRPIPRFPDAIGLIVGKDSAAEADLIRNITRRWPLTDIYLFPAQVQGKDAPKSILTALETAETYPLDTLIIARGGGSSEDLSAFNDEKLVRAVAACPIPTISAVGHEIDTTLIDYVSDLRVSTPTGAAEAATPDQEEIRRQLLDLEERLENANETYMSNLRQQVEHLAKRPFFTNPASLYENAIKETKNLEERLALAEQHRLLLAQKQLEGYAARLKSVNPDNVIKRGYSVTLDESGKPITSVKQAHKGQRLNTKLKDGIIVSTIEEGKN